MTMTPSQRLKQAYADVSPIYNPLLLIWLPNFMVTLAASLALAAIVPGLPLPFLDQVLDYAWPLQLHSYFTLDLQQTLLIILAGQLGYQLLLAPWVQATAIAFSHDHLEGKYPTILGSFQQTGSQFFQFILSEGLAFAAGLPVLAILLGLSMVLQDYPIFLMIMPIVSFILNTYLAIHLLFRFYPIVLNHQSALQSFMDSWQLCARNWPRVLAGYLFVTTGLSIVSFLPNVALMPPAAFAPILKAPPLDPKLIQMIAIGLNHYLSFLFMPVLTLYYLLMYRSVMDSEASSNKPFRLMPVKPKQNEEI